jgi:hypothetical protein
MLRMIMGSVRGPLAKPETQDVSGKAIATLDHADAVMATLQSTLGRIDKHDLGSKSKSSLTDLNVAANKTNKMPYGVGNATGLV